MEIVPPCNLSILALHKTLPDWVCYQTIEENKKGNIYLKNCTGVTESQIVRMCKSYLTFSRDRNTAPVYDEPTGHVIGLYNVSYSRTGWPFGTHWTRILDDNEIVLRNDFSILRLVCLVIIYILRRLKIIKGVLHLRYWMERYLKNFNVYRNCIYHHQAVSFHLFLDEFPF